MGEDGLTSEQRQALREQFVAVHAKSQDDYDASVRTIAAASVGVTISLAAAVKGFNGWGSAAFVFLLLSLGQLASHQSAQRDVLARVARLQQTRDDRERNGWTVVRAWLNLLAGAFLLVGGVLLAIFVGTADFGGR